MVRPLVLLFQEFATQTAVATTPDLNTILLGAAYQIYDYPDDKLTIEVSPYGQFQANAAYTLPVANTPAITLAGLPNAAPGSWVDPASVRIYFDDARAVLVQGTDGGTPNQIPYENYFSSVTGTFVTNKVQAGDSLIVTTDGSDLTLTILGVESETLLRVASNFEALATNLAYRIERKIASFEINKSFVALPAFRESNEIKILGGVTATVGNKTAKISYARVYVGYRALRTDLQRVDSVSSTEEIKTKVGRIDARNPLAAALFVSRQNAGQAPIYFYGVRSDDLEGYSLARDVVSVNGTVYAVVPLTNDLPTIASFKIENDQLADPNIAINTGVPQKFRVVIGSGTLPLTSTLVPENNDGVVEQQEDAIPPGLRTITISDLQAQSRKLLPGDKITIVASNVNPSVDGTYTIAHINSDTQVEVEETFPAAVNTAAAMNYSIFRPTTHTTLVPASDMRIGLELSGVVFKNRLAGVQSPARQILFVQDDTTPNGVQSVIEIAGVSTTFNADFESGAVSGKKLANALQGLGVTVPFFGSANFSVEINEDTAITEVPSTLEFDTPLTGYTTKSLTSIEALDGVYNRFYDADASFFSSGVLPGDTLEIAKSVNGNFTSTVRRFTVDQVLSEQRIRIVSQANGIYKNNTANAEFELPHGDTREGLGTILDPNAVRYRVIRTLTKDQQVAELVSVSQSFNSRRALLTWPDKVHVAGLVDGSKARNADGTMQAADPQPGWYLSALLGGMTAGLPSQQGFSRLGVAGITLLEHSSDYFSEKQLTDLSDGGWYVFAQSSPTSLPYSIHQLTTDPSTLESGEFSVVKNYDYVGLYFLSILEPFLGTWNVNPDTVGFVRQAMNTGIEQLKLRRIAKIGAPLTDATLTSVEVSNASTDRIEIYATVGLPKPLNVLGLHLVA